MHRAKLQHAPPMIQDLLKPQSKRLSKDVRLREDDPEAFGLLVEWLSDWPLPEFGIWSSMTGDRVSATYRSLENLGVPAASIPSKIDPRKFPRRFMTAEDSRGLGHGDGQRWAHVNFSPEYINFSPEELRLIDTCWDAGLIENYASSLSEEAVCDETAHPKTTNALRKQGDRNRFELQDKSRAKEYLQAEGVLGEGDVCRSVEGEYFQYTVLKLVLFAAKYDWPILLTGAVESYRKGEHYIARMKLPVRHFVLAYASLDPASSPGREVLAFMADYAFQISRTRSMQSRWLEIGNTALMKEVLLRYEKTRPGTVVPSPLTRKWVYDDGSC